MDAFLIRGGQPLRGVIDVAGSKNAALPQMAAALLTDEPLTLRRAPDLADIRNMKRLLGELGVRVELEQADASQRSGADIRLQVDHDADSHARYDIVRTMRASVCVLGPLLAKRGEARVSMPGGCAIGDRPIDLHLRGLAALGARIDLDAGDIVARAPKSTSGGRRLRGGRIFLGGPFGSTVLGTANVMAAATLAEGATIIESAACEPEIADLASLLTAMGARIEGAGGPRIRVHGVQTLGGAEHEVMPDRIEAGTLMTAAALTGGEVVVRRAPLEAMAATIDRLEAAGVMIEAGGDPFSPTPCDCLVRRTGPIRPVQATTQPHPGFPTDLQAQLMAMLTLAQGNSVITEKIFPERFLHVAELARMGARLIRQGATVVVSGVDRLVGAPVMASDLRASAGLVLAGLAAHGETTVRRVYHIDRGYERIEQALQELGADIERVREDEAEAERPQPPAASLVGEPMDG